MTMYRFSQGIFGTEKHVFGFPECLRVDKIDSVFRLVGLAFLPIEFEVHEDLRNALRTGKRLFVHAVIELPEELVVFFLAALGGKT